MRLSDSIRFYAATDVGKGEVEKRVNDKLLQEARKNQCSFKSDSDQLAPGCDKKIKKLADTLIDAKKKLQAAGVSGFKFEVSGHTDSAGSAEHNKELSAKRAAVPVPLITTAPIRLVMRCTRSGSMTCVAAGVGGAQSSARSGLYVQYIVCLAIYAVLA